MLQRLHVRAAIPTGRDAALLDWDEDTIRKLTGRAVDVLVQTGLCLTDDCEGVYLGQMARRGLRVDQSNRAVYFSEEQINQTLEVMRQTKQVDRSVDSARSEFGGQRASGTYLVGNGASFLFDCDQWEARPASTEEFVGILEWAQGSDAVGELFAPCAVGDVDPRLSPIHVYSLLGRFCHKPFYHEQPTEVVHLKYFEEMARLVEAARGFYQPMQEWEFIIPPMKLAVRSIETMLSRIDLGLCSAVGIGSMAVRGMTAPVTVAGTAITGLAEILAGLTFFRILRPKVRMAIPWVTATDFRIGGDVSRYVSPGGVTPGLVGNLYYNFGATMPGWNQV